MITGQINRASDKDVFVAKLDGSGNEEWTRNFGNEHI